jgi:hypothetical protein
MIRALRLAAILLLACTMFGNTSGAAEPDSAKFSADTLYNLANSYARAGKPGLAVLNYERAGLLEPNDPDIIANLQYVRTVAGLPPLPRSRFDRIATIAGPQLLSWLGLIGVVIIGVSMIARRLYPKHGFKLGAVALLGLLLVAATLCNAYVLWPTLHEAVVVSATAEARVSPVPMGEPLFTLREAETLRISARHDTFVLIQSSTGRKGWVSTDNLAPVVPQANTASSLSAP